MLIKDIAVVRIARYVNFLVMHDCMQSHLRGLRVHDDYE